MNEVLVAMVSDSFYLFKWDGDEFEWPNVNEHFAFGEISFPTSFLYLCRYENNTFYFAITF